jgi:hypothetical protein
MTETLLVVSGTVPSISAVVEIPAVVSRTASHRRSIRTFGSHHLPAPGARPHGFRLVAHAADTFLPGSTPFTVKHAAPCLVTELALRTGAAIPATTVISAFLAFTYRSAGLTDTSLADPVVGTTRCFLFYRYRQAAFHSTAVIISTDIAIVTIDFIGTDALSIAAKVRLSATISIIARSFVVYIGYHALSGCGVASNNLTFRLGWFQARHNRGRVNDTLPLL